MKTMPKYEEAVINETASVLDVMWFLAKMLFIHGNRPVVTSSFQRYESLSVTDGDAGYDKENRVIYLPGT